MAISLAARGMRVQLLDCDVEEPNVHLLLQPHLIRTKNVGMALGGSRRLSLIASCQSAYS